MSTLSSNDELFRHPILLTLGLAIAALTLTLLTTLIPQDVPRHHLDPSAVIADSDYISLQGIPRPFRFYDPRSQRPPLFSRIELAFNFAVDFACASAVVCLLIFFTEGIPYLSRRSSRRRTPQTQ